MLAACGVQGAKPRRFQADIFRLSFHPGLMGFTVVAEVGREGVAEASALPRVFEVDTVE